MNASEMEELAQGKFGKRWKQPLSNAIGLHRRSIQFYLDGRSIPPLVAEKIRHATAIGPVGKIIRDAVRRAVPEIAPVDAHKAAVAAERQLELAGLIKRE